MLKIMKMFESLGMVDLAELFKMIINILFKINIL